MNRLRKHVHWLHILQFIRFVQESEITRLGRRIAGNVNDSRRSDFQQLLDYGDIHAIAGRIGDNHIRAAMLGEKLFCEQGFHVSGVETQVAESIELQVM